MNKNDKEKTQAEEDEVLENEEVQESEAEPEMSEEEKLRKSLDEKDDQLKRIAAEYDNFRKRTIKEREENFSNAKICVISEFLDVIDNFQRAKDADCELEAYKKGVEMIFTQFCDKMKNLGVEEFGKPGDTFDPEIHMAVMHIEDDEKGEGEVIEVFQKGYKAGEKIIRHAMVKVAN